MLSTSLNKTFSSILSLYINHISVYFSRFPSLDSITERPANPINLPNSTLEFLRGWNTESIVTSSSSVSKEIKKSPSESCKGIPLQQAKSQNRSSKSELIVHKIVVPGTTPLRPPRSKQKTMQKKRKKS